MNTPQATANPHVCPKTPTKSKRQSKAMRKNVNNISPSTRKVNVRLDFEENFTTPPRGSRINICPDAPRRARVINELPNNVVIPRFPLQDNSSK